jgi:hypothetical protein
VTVWAVESFTVKVTTPLELDAPLAAEIVELPLPAASVTVLPLTGLLPASSSVTVIVEVVEPSAATDVGLALTVDFDALTDPVVTLNPLLVLLVSPLLVAVSS